MATTITCAHCNNRIEITEAIRHELEEKVLAETQAAHEQALKLLQKEKDDLVIEKEKEIQKISQQAQIDARKEAIEKVRQEYDSKIASTKEDVDAKEKQNKELQEQTKDLLRQMRELKDEQSKAEIAFEKKLLDEQDKIKQQAKKEAHDEMNLHIAEKDKKLTDAEKQILELQRKLQQGSQQLQGEVLELNFEQELRTAFPHDVIEPVEKGVKGADVRQIVKSPRGTICGTILWENKRTKAWSDGWIEKLKSDLRAEKANVPVIVSTVLPKEFTRDLGFKDGVWISSYQLAIPLAQLLRKNLLDLGYQQAVSAHRGEKAERLYGYVTSHEFRQQVEAMVEVFTQMKGQITKERVAFERMWKAREKQAEQLFGATANIVGSIQGEVGQTAFQIKGLELLEEGEE